VIDRKRGKDFTTAAGTRLGPAFQIHILHIYMNKILAQHSHPYRLSHISCIHFRATQKTVDPRPLQPLIRPCRDIRPKIEDLDPRPRKRLKPAEREDDSADPRPYGKDEDPRPSTRSIAPQEASWIAKVLDGLDTRQKDPRPNAYLVKLALARQKAKG